jgi:hypothetical protein
MTKKEINALDNEQLLSAFYWIGVKATNEENYRGVTKKTVKEESYLIEEITNRFGLDADSFRKRIIR